MPSTSMVHIGKIATGEIENEREEKLANTAAELGSKGGKARAAALTSERRREIGRPNGEAS